jgi:FRG domain-containing protein
MGEGHGMSNSGGMEGQWVGTYAGSSSGSVIINVDKCESNYRGVAYLFGDDKALPGSAAAFTTATKDKDFSIRTDWILALDRASGQAIPLEGIAQRYPNVLFPKYADVKGSFDKDALKLSWTTDLGTANSSVLPRSKAGQASELVASEQDWETFKQRLSTDLPKRYLFRGQNGPWRLRTSFHRAGRADLQRFLNEDVPALHRQLSARTRHIFNLSIGDENGAFFNLVQHHGYPTPLLDWTYSPYVAAFFAYRGITNARAAKAEKKDKVRVLVFDQAQWRRDWNQLLMLVCPTLHLSIGEFIAIENERMIPQQAASTVTNVDDIESYIRSKETVSKKYLWAIDMPMSERQHVVSELSYMGITAGSMFPGLDGACEELKERNFDI